MEQGFVVRSIICGTLKSLPTVMANTSLTSPLDPRQARSEKLGPKPRRHQPTWAPAAFRPLRTSRLFLPALPGRNAGQQNRRRDEEQGTPQRKSRLADYERRTDHENAWARRAMPPAREIH